MGRASVLVESVQGVRTVTLDAPERFNALDLEMLERAAIAIEAPPGDDRVVVLRGSGRAFCSGAHLSDAERVGARAEHLIDSANRLVAAIVRGPLPVVSVVGGPCAGVGVSIAVAADLVVASSSAFFQLAFANVGLMPDGGATALLAASVGRARAARMSLLAERLGAQEALHWGLVTHVAEPADLEDVVTAVVGTLRNGPAVATAHARRAINAAALGGLDAAFARERTGQASLLRSTDFVEGVSAFRDRRPAVFRDRLPRRPVEH